MNFYYAESCLLNDPLEILQSNQPPHTFDGRRFLFRVKGMDGFKRSSKTELHLTISFEIYDTFFIFTCSFVRLLDSILLATNEQSVLLYRSSFLFPYYIFHPNCFPFFPSFFAFHNNFNISLYSFCIVPTGCIIKNDYTQL